MGGSGVLARLGGLDELAPHMRPAGRMGENAVLACQSRIRTVAIADEVQPRGWIMAVSLGRIGKKELPSIRSSLTGAYLARMKRMTQGWRGITANCSDSS